MYGLRAGKKQKFGKMAPILFFFTLLVWNYPEVLSRPTENVNVVICNHNICIAGKIEKGGTCVCCIVCQASFNRENGIVDCPLSRLDCSDQCIAGYENQPVFNGGTLDVCRRSKATTKLPDIPSAEEKSDNQVNSGTVAAAVVVPLIFVVIVIVAVIYKLRSDKCKTSELELNDLNVGAESTEEEAEVKVESREPEENTDVTAVTENTDETAVTENTDVAAVTENPQRPAKIEENHFEQSSPIDENETNPNQTFQPNVFDQADEPPLGGGGEIPSAPHYTEDTNPSLSSTYSTPTAGIDDIFRGLANGSNTPPERVHLTMNLDLTLTTLQN